MKQFWLNLPVKNIDKSKTFFTQLGFKLNLKHGGGPDSACLLLGDGNVPCMLFEENTFKGFTNTDITKTNQSTEVLLSIDAQSKEEVDELVEKVIAAGGTSSHKPYSMQGPMYGCVFNDLDGHKWNVLYMKDMK